MNPVTKDTPIDQGNIPLQDEESSSSEPSSPVPPVEAKLLQGLITSAISQGLSSIANRQDDQEMQGECNLCSQKDAAGGRKRETQLNFYWYMYLLVLQIQCISV